MLASREPAGSGLLRGLVFFIISALIGAAALFFGAQRLSLSLLDDRFASIEAELVQTREALDSARMDLEISLGARAELERQLAALNEQHKQTREELEFMRSANKPAAAR